MLELTRWSPRSENAMDFVDRFFQRALGGYPSSESETTLGSRWAPATDIRETEDTYEVTAELPGLKKDDVHVTLENNVLTLSGERKLKDEEETKDHHRVERRYGAFFRSFTLPNKVDTDKVEATFEDGVLQLTIPKTEEVKPRRILIN